MEKVVYDSRGYGLIVENLKINFFVVILDYKFLCNVILWLKEMFLLYCEICRVEIIFGMESDLYVILFK